MIYCKSNNSRVYKLKRYHTYVQISRYSATRDRPRAEERIAQKSEDPEKKVPRNWPRAVGRISILSARSIVALESPLRKWRTIEARSSILSHSQGSVPLAFLSSVVAASFFPLSFSTRMCVYEVEHITDRHRDRWMARSRSIHRIRGTMI